MKTLSDTACEKIVQMIREKKFGPGDPLPEAALCRLLKMSRTPIREALQRLQDENIVTIKPRNGAFVASLDLQRLRNIYEVRETVESMIAYLNCRQHLPIESYVQMRSSMETLLAGPSTPERTTALDKLGREMLEMMMKNCDNTILSNICKTMLAQIDTLAHITRTLPRFPDQSTPEHVAILNAIIDKDASLADAATRTHIRNSVSRILNYTGM